MTMNHAKHTTLAILLCGVWIGASTPLLAQVTGTALPTNGTVTSGSAQISTTPGRMTVTQTTSQAQIDWNTFNIGPSAAVTFKQPDAASVAVNRVLSSDPSAIYGTLSANGNVFLVNPNGVYFAPGSRVDVGGLVASAMALKGSAPGHYDFAATKPSGVVNDGTITAGNIALIGPKVTNNGTITATHGTAALASGGAVTLTFGANADLAITVDKATLAAAVKNNGAIIAPNGQANLTGAASDSLVNSLVNAPAGAGALVSVNGVPTLVSNAGRVQAKSVTLSSGSNGGVNVTGTLDAASATGMGGQIALTGQEITLGSTARLKADGATGGGAVLVGGDWQGSGSLPQASYVTIDTGAQLSANALGSGTGGRIVAWTDITNTASVTAVHGTLSATAAAGGGGQIETSGHVLDVAGATVTTAGTQAGTWLLDPYNITIDGSITAGGTLPGFTANADSTINAGDITTALANSNVTISTGSSGSSAGDITVNGAVSWSSANSLSLTAAHDIAVNASIQNSGPGGVTLDAGNNVTIGSSGSSALIAVGSALGSTTVTAAQNVTLQGSSTGTGFGAQIGYNHTSNSQPAPTGDISVTATAGDVNLLSGTGTAAFAQIGHGGYQPSGNTIGNIGENVANGHATTITVNAGRDVTLLGAASGGSYAYAMIGNGGEQDSSSVMGDVFGNISVTAARAAVLYGGGYGNYAQIGNGGGTEESATRGTMGGTIAVDVTGSTADATTNNAATGAVPQSGSLTLNSVTNSDEAYVQIGHGGVIDSSIQGNISGNIDVTASQTLTLVSSASCTSPCLPTADTAYVQIGHGGLNEHGGTPPTISNATLTINAYQIDTQGNFYYDPIGSRIATASGNTGTTVNVTSTTNVTTQAAGTSTGNYSYAAGSTTTQVNQSGNGISLTPTLTGGTAQTVDYGASPALSGTSPNVSAPVSTDSGGAVTYSSSDTTIATVDANGNVTFKKPGVVSITANVAANGSYAAAQTKYDVRLNPATPTLSLSDVAKTYANATTFTLPATTGSASTGAVSYSVTSGNAASVSGGNIVFSAPGTVTVQASQAASGFYGTATKTFTYTLNPATPVLAPLTDLTVTEGAAPQFETTSSISAGAISYASSNPGVVSVDPTTGKVTFLKPGRAVITASQTANGYYSAPQNVSYAVKVNVAAKGPTIYNGDYGANGAAVTGDGGGANTGSNAGLVPVAMTQRTPTGPQAPTGTAARGGQPINTGVAGGNSGELVVTAGAGAVPSIQAPAASAPSGAGIYTNPVKPVRLTGKTPFNVALARSTFVAQNPKSVLAYTATLTDGRPLPSWMRFDARQFALVGTVPGTGAQTVAVRLTATDQFGNTATTTLRVQVK